MPRPTHTAQRAPALGVLPPELRPAAPPRKPCRVCGKRVCSCVEDLLAGQMRAAGYPEPVREHRFARDVGRGWRFDFAWPFIRLAAEVEGGIWTGGRHVTGAGYAGDLEKYNEGALLGWLIVRFTSEMVEDGRALRVVERALNARGVQLGDGAAVYTRRYPAGKG